MRLFHIHLLPLLQIALLAAAQLNTLPPCVQTCLHNAVPSCSGLKCYCSAFTSTLLLSAASCYHTLCDSTTPSPYNILIADIAPMCSKEGVPILQAQLDKAAAQASSSSYSTYISFSDPPRSDVGPTGVSADGAVATGVVLTTTAQKATPTVFVSGSRMRVGLEGTGTAMGMGVGVVATSTMEAAAGGSNGEGSKGVMAGTVIGVIGVILELLG